MSRIYVQGTISTSGDTTIIPGVTGRKIHLCGLQVQNAAAASTTALVKFGASIFLAVIMPTTGDGVARDFGDPVEVPYETSVVVNLSAGNATYYQAVYEVN